MHLAWLSKKLKNNFVQCLACNHYCQIAPKKAGICNVRQNIDGKLYSLVYANPASVNVDPIEKKPLYHFLPGTEVFSLGTLGCNFKCGFCQNWTISQTNLPTAESWAIDSPWSPEKVVNYCLKNKIPSIAYTYNEPAVFFEYVFDIAKLAHQKGIKNILVSNGYFSQEALQKIASFIDAMNIDLKSFNKSFYQKVCAGKLNFVLENIKELVKRKIWLEITTLVIPGQNDKIEELKNLAEFIKNIDKNIPWHLSAFYPIYKMQNLLPTSLEKLIEIYTMAKKIGLKNVYLGNLREDQYSATYCPQCEQVLIKRQANGFGIDILWKDTCVCPKCGKKILGVWE